MWGWRGPSRLTGGFGSGESVPMPSYCSEPFPRYLQHVGLKSTRRKQRVREALRVPGIFIPFLTFPCFSHINVNFFFFFLARKGEGALIESVCINYALVKIMPQFVAVLTISLQAERRGRV